MILTHINIGTNLGRRTANIDSAVTLLSSHGRIEAVSTPVLSRPWGYESPNYYVNVGVNLLTNLSAEELLNALKSIERTIDPLGSHRTAAGEYADRRIDLDIIAYGDETVESIDLQIPHPRMQERGFVLTPMAEIWPDWCHPTLLLTAQELLTKLNNKRDPVCVYEINKTNTTLS